MSGNLSALRFEVTLVITIDEKIKLFTKIVYDKVEKENKEQVEKFNDEYGKIVDQKKAMFEQMAEKMEEQIYKTAKGQARQIASKAKIDAKMIRAAKRNELFNRARREILEYAVKFTSDPRYEKMLVSQFEEAVNETDGKDSVKVLLSKESMDMFKDKLKNLAGGRKLAFEIDDTLLGGFILIDESNNTRIDMSFSSRIDGAEDMIGEKLLAILH